MRGTKQTQQLARQLFQLSLDANGHLSAERVAGVLEYVEKHAPAKPLALLQAYKRLIAREVARGQALVEHAGPVDESLLKTIEGAMSQRYHRPVVASGKANPALLAGLRIRVGDDVFETSVSAQLDTLAASV
jgi:F-type H+-transporting ATPase subunit delta